MDDALMQLKIGSVLNFLLLLAGKIQNRANFQSVKWNFGKFELSMNCRKKWRQSYLFISSKSAADRYSSSWIISKALLGQFCYFVKFTLSNMICDVSMLLISAAYQLVIHCNPLQGQYRARTGISLCPFSLWEKVHRENPVFITGMGLQCMHRKLIS